MGEQSGQNPIQPTPEQATSFNPDQTVAVNLKTEQSTPDLSSVTSPEKVAASVEARVNAPTLDTTPVMGSVTPDATPAQVIDIKPLQISEPPISEHDTQPNSATQPMPAVNVASTPDISVNKGGGFFAKIGRLFGGGR